MNYLTSKIIFAQEVLKDYFRWKMVTAMQALNSERKEMMD